MEKRDNGSTLPTHSDDGTDKGKDELTGENVVIAGNSSDLSTENASGPPQKVSKQDRYDSPSAGARTASPATGTENCSPHPSAEGNTVSKEHNDSRQSGESESQSTSIKSTIHCPASSAQSQKADSKEAATSQHDPAAPDVAVGDNKTSAAEQAILEGQPVNNELAKAASPSNRDTSEVTIENSCKDLVSVKDGTSSTSDGSPSQSVKDAGETKAKDASTTCSDGAASQLDDTSASQSASSSAAAAAAGTASSSSSSSAAAAELAARRPAACDQSPLQSVYHVKWVRFRTELVPIITQNENGPCPLLAIMNVLLLQGKVKLPPMMEMVTSGQLMDYLGDCIFENAPKNIAEEALLNYEQNMHDAMAVFHKLQTGLDVNVRFTGVAEFEYTPECIVFDLLGIRLYHGWLVDPQNEHEVTALANCSYNQLVEKIITLKNSSKEDDVTEALVAENFLAHSSHQLTYHGLSELVSTIKADELSVFFRNNHFSTLYKVKNELFLLVTDQGFLTENNVVWETLFNVEGDSYFVDTEFHTYRKAEPSTHPIPTPSVDVGSDQQIDQDYLVALSLQQEQQLQTQSVTPEWTASTRAPTDTDHQLALKLQEEENRRANTPTQRQPASGGSPQHAQSQPTAHSQAPHRQPQHQHHHQQQQQQQQQQQSHRQPQTVGGNTLTRENSREKKSDCVIL